MAKYHSLDFLVTDEFRDVRCVSQDYKYYVSIKIVRVMFRGMKLSACLQRKPTMHYCHKIQPHCPSMDIHLDEMFFSRQSSRY